MTDPMLDPAAFHAMFAEQAEIGRTSEGGLHRVAASPTDGEVRDWLSDWFAHHVCGENLMVDGGWSVGTPVELGPEREAAAA